MTKLMRLALIILLFFVCCLLVCLPAVRVAGVAHTVPVEQLAEPDSLFVDVNGLQVHYKVGGEDVRTLVLLHGFAASVFSWRKVM